MGRKNSLAKNDLGGIFPCYPCFWKIKGVKKRMGRAVAATLKAEMFFGKTWVRGEEAA